MKFSNQYRVAVIDKAGTVIALGERTTLARGEEIAAAARKVEVVVLCPGDPLIRSSELPEMT